MEGSSHSLIWGTRWHSHGGSEENDKNYQGGWCYHQDLNLIPPKYDTV
jgi:hypothetical protein